MSADDQCTKWCRHIAENFNRLSRAHERYRQTTDGPSVTSFTFAKNATNKGTRPGNLFLELLNVDFGVRNAGGAAKVTENVVTSGRTQYILRLQSQHTNKQQSVQLLSQYISK